MTLSIKVKMIKIEYYHKGQDILSGSGKKGKLAIKNIAFVGFYTFKND